MAAIMEVLCPPEFSGVEVVKFLNDLYSHKNEEDLVINFRNICFSYPFGILLAAIGIRNLIKERKSNGLKTVARGYKKSTGAHSYLKHLGFFKFIYIEEGKEPNQARGSNRYLPITIIRDKDLYENREVVQDQIERECDRLSQVIFSGEKNLGRAMMFSYCLREVVRNVYEHAETKSCFVVAQRWADGVAEIAIADQGIGLIQSLSKAHKVDSPAKGIQMAMTPGISADYSRGQTKRKWQNSGFGLYVSSQLGARYGEFSLGSDDKIIFKNSGGEIWSDAPISGTVVQIRVNTQDADYFPNILSQIVKNGEAVAETTDGAKKSASKMAKLDDITW